MYSKQNIEIVWSLFEINNYNRQKSLNFQAIK